MSIRTKYPKKVLKFQTRAQEAEWNRKMQLAVAANPKRQRLVFAGQDKVTKKIWFDNFFVKFDENGKALYWTGYKFSIDRDGSVTIDRTWKCAKKLDGSLVLVKSPATFALVQALNA